MQDAQYWLNEFEVAQVADVLRRDQKCAPVGRPSVHIVQLRKQQAATKQAALIARQVVAQATADRQRRGVGSQRREGLAVAVHIAGQAPRRQPAPGRARLQQQRSVGALAQCRGQRDRLADIARAAVSDRPGRARSFHHWH